MVGPWGEEGVGAVDADRTPAAGPLPDPLPQFWGRGRIRGRGRGHGSVPGCGGRWVTADGRRLRGDRPRALIDGHAAAAVDRAVPAAPRDGSRRAGHHANGAVDDGQEGLAPVVADPLGQRLELRGDGGRSAADADRLQRADDGALGAFGLHDDQRLRAADAAAALGQRVEQVPRRPVERHGRERAPGDVLDGVRHVDLAEGVARRQVGLRGPQPVLDHVQAPRRQDVKQAGAGAVQAADGEDDVGHVQAAAAGGHHRPGAAQGLERLGREAGQRADEGGRGGGVGGGGRVGGRG